MVSPGKLEIESPVGRASQGGMVKVIGLGGFQGCVHPHKQDWQGALVSVAVEVPIFDL